MSGFRCFCQRNYSGEMCELLGDRCTPSELLSEHSELARGKKGRGKKAGSEAQNWPQYVSNQQLQVKWEMAEEGHCNLRSTMGHRSVSAVSALRML